MSEFRIALEKRAPLHRKLVELKASQRAAAAVTGSSKGTVYNDLKDTDAQSWADDDPQPQDSADPGQSDDTDAQSWADVTSNGDVPDGGSPDPDDADPAPDDPDEWWGPGEGRTFARLRRFQIGQLVTRW